MDWISVEDRLPEDGAIVMLATLAPPIRESLTTEVGYYSGGKWFVNDNDGFTDEVAYKILYWAVYPKAPPTPLPYRLLR